MVNKISKDDIQERLSIDPLTEREIAILDRISSGLTNREIAEDLFLALETVRWYTKRIYSKLYVRNRTEAAALARELGLLTTRDQEPATDQVMGLPKYKLPGQVTAFVGRSRELEDFSRLLSQPENRLFTLLGPGGMGKTRLAIQIAKASISSFNDGVFFVTLDNMGPQDHLGPIIAEHLDLKLDPSGNPEEQIIEFFADRNLLLVLDNFENALQEKNQLSDFLLRAEGLKIISTSRVRLDLSGEIVYKLEGLELPSDDLAAAIAQAESVQLFIRTASQVHPNIVFQDHDLPHIARICYMVAGMPLGIVLAAAWIEVLSPQAIAAEVKSTLDFLATEKQDIPERQRSIRAVFDHSLHLLHPDEQDIFIHLSVFTGGFTRSAAESVAGADVKHLASFSGKSLLQFEPISKRYDLHPLLRHYALEKLDDSGQIQHARAAHLNYYAAFLRDIEDGLQGRDQSGALDSFSSDFPNIRAAWMWAVQEKRIEWVDQAVEAVYWGCLLRGKIPDGEALFAAVRKELSLETLTGDPFYPRLLLRFDAAGEEYTNQLLTALHQPARELSARERAFLRWALGVNQYTLRKFRAAIKSLHESFAAFENLGDIFYQIETLHLLWMCHWFLGETEAGKIFYEQSLQLARDSKNTIALARALAAGGAFELIAGQFGNAEALTQEALHLRKEMSDRSGVAMSLTYLGWLAALRGDYEEGCELAEEGLQIAKAIHNANSRTTALNILGWIACLLEDYEMGRSFCEESLDRSPDPTVRTGAFLGLAFAYYGLGQDNLARDFLVRTITFAESANGYGILLICLPVAALLMARAGREVQAVEFMSLALRFPDNDIGWMHRWRPAVELIRELRDKLEEDGFNAAWKAGKEQPLETVFEKLRFD